MIKLQSYRQVGLTLAGTILFAAAILSGDFCAAGDEFPSLSIPTEATEPGDADRDALTGTLVTSASALLVVLGLFAGLVWLQRRVASQRGGDSAVPESVLERLGTVQIDVKTQATLVKFGDRLLLIGQSTSGQLQTLAELTDPDEVARMTNRCLGRPEIVGRRSTTPRRNMAAG